MITGIWIAGIYDNFASEVELDTLIYPLSKFSWIPELQGDGIPRTNSGGSWKTRRRVHEMTIECSGAILADTTSDWWTRQKALKQKVVPPPTYADYDHARFRVIFDGDATNYYAYCDLESNIGALDVSIGSPTVSEWELIFANRDGYWSTNTDRENPALVVI